MKKMLLGITAATLALTLTGCGASANDAAIKNLSTQLDKTSNTIVDLDSFNPSDISMTKESLNALATDSDKLYNDVARTQSTLLNEGYFKADILNQTAKIKSCLSKSLKLSKAQISAVKDLTTNLQKYTNSISYTQGELNSSIKSVSSMKKNPSKNSEKISAKLNRIACNSNSRMAYYENIINTLNNLEDLFCCEDCVQDDNSSSVKQDSNEQSKSEISTDQKDNNTKNVGLPINIDTYAPMNRNIDTIGYNRAFNGFARNNIYGYGNSYGYNGINGFYGNGYTSAPGVYGNAMFGYGRAAYPIYPYQNTIYNSNNINRMAYGAVPVSDTNVEQRLEDFEEMKDGELKEINNQAQENAKNTTVESSTDTNNSVENVANKTMEVIDDLGNEAVSTSAREIKENKQIKDTRSKEEIQKDLDQPIIAH